MVQFGLELEPADKREQRKQEGDHDRGDSGDPDHHRFTALSLPNA
jgi:hypothetical protein